MTIGFILLKYPHFHHTVAGLIYSKYWDFHLFVGWRYILPIKQVGGSKLFDKQSCVVDGSYYHNISPCIV